MPSGNCQKIINFFIETLISLQRQRGDKVVWVVTMNFFRGINKKIVVFFVLVFSIVVSNVLGWGRTQVAQTAQPSNAGSVVGTNLHAVSDWSSSFPFIDAFKASRSWIPHYTYWDKNTNKFITIWDTGEQDLIDLDQNGWVRSLPVGNDWRRFRSVVTTMFTELNGRYPAGKYLVLYDGEGTVEYSGDAKLNVAESRPNRHVIDVTPNNGINLIISSTDPNKKGNYIRNIRVLFPGYDENSAANQIFFPAFLNSLSKYKSIRFMDWMRVNWSTDGKRARALIEPQPVMVHPLDTLQEPTLRSAELYQPTYWRDRPMPSDARYSTHEGVPIELMVALSNQLHADPWFSVVHTADDNYIREMARLVRSSLNPQLKLYLEYSNEVWNDSFGQAMWVGNQGIKLWPNANDDKNGLFRRLNFYAKRSVEICQLWKQEWGNDKARVVCVMSAQSANKWVAETMLKCPLWKNAPCSKGIDAIAIAPYFGQYLGGDAYNKKVLEWTQTLPRDKALNNLFREIKYGDVLLFDEKEQKSLLSSSYEMMRFHADLAKQHGIKLVSYEGGQHLALAGRNYKADSAEGLAIAELFTAANRDFRMGLAYTEYLDAWRNSTDGIFMHYIDTGVHGVWGNWGSQEYLDQPNAFKKQAITQYIIKNICGSIECPVIPTNPNVEIRYQMFLPILNRPWEGGGSRSQPYP